MRRAESTIRSFKGTHSRLWPPIPFPSSNPLHSLAVSSNVTLCSAPRSIVAITLAAEENALAVINLRGKGEYAKGPLRAEGVKSYYMGIKGSAKKENDIHSRIKKQFET